MPAPKTITWTMDPHTNAKHVILEKYLQAWLPIMAITSERIVVLDGFAGPGEYAGGQKGSPLIALDALLNHSYEQLRDKEVVYIFVEKDEARCEHLKGVLAARTLPPRVKVHVYCGMFDETLCDLLNVLEEQNTWLAPTFAFIDPFGYSHTPMSTIARLMQHPKCEVFINFMYEEVNRFITHPNAAHQATIDRLFGTEEWRSIDWKALTPQERESAMGDLYTRQLKNAGGVRYVRSFRMVNTGNRTDYLLFFGTSHLKGLNKMKQAMWKVDDSGSYQYSDCTDSNQPTLFVFEPDFEPFRLQLLSHFSGKVVAVQDVEDYVIAETAYHSGQYKKNALKVLEKEGLVTAVAPPSGRKAGTYSDKNMRLRFANTPS